jgi:hypothetical protein
VEFRSPAGVLGRLVDAVFLTRHLERLLRTRPEVISHEAETRTSTGEGG